MLKESWPPKSALGERSGGAHQASPSRFAMREVGGEARKTKRIPGTRLRAWAPPPRAGAAEVKAPLLAPCSGEMRAESGLRPGHPEGHGGGAPGAWRSGQERRCPPTSGGKAPDPSRVRDADRGSGGRRPSPRWLPTRAPQLPGRNMQSSQVGREAPGAAKRTPTPGAAGSQS